MSTARVGIGLGTSLVVHSVIAIALFLMLDAIPAPQQKLPPSRIDLASQVVRQQAAQQRQADAEHALATQPDGVSSVGQAIAKTRANAVPIDAPPSQPVRSEKRISAQDISAKLIESAEPQVNMATFASEIESVPITTTTPTAKNVSLFVANALLVGEAPRPEKVVEQTPVDAPSLVVASTLPQAQKLGSKSIRMASAQTVNKPASVAISLQSTEGHRAQAEIDTKGKPVFESRYSGVILRDTVTATKAVATMQPNSDVLEDSTLTQTDAPSAEPDSARVLATLAGFGEDSANLSPKGLQTLQAFLAPEGVEGQKVRDAIADLIAIPECSRVQTAFDPTHGAIELRGHVASEDARAPLIFAMRDQIGSDMEIRDNLRILPAPQCGVLSGMERLGLPQSEEQLNDPLLIGKATQAREFSFQDGERMVIDLQAPSYEAYVYVDYFDSDGQVVHLLPNERAPLQMFDLDQPFALGKDGLGFELRVAPPFGQDIVVGFASDVPLYQGLRPLVEPAAPYIDFLTSRMSEVGPEKGEWFYLFVQTGPKVQ